MYNSVKALQIGLAALLFAVPYLSAETNTISTDSAIAPYGIGSTPTAVQIQGWDIDVRPDGKGLPEGIEGDLALGEETYDEKCSVCHGTFGESVARWPKLAGGEVSQLKNDRSAKTIGSYWPYATTLWDYINRAMPFHTAKTLNPEEVYALTGYILYLNDLVDDDFVANKASIVAMNQKMPNRDGFYFDDRPDSPNTRCMSDCAETVSIHSEATEVGVTPEDNTRIEPTATADAAADSEPNISVAAEAAENAVDVNDRGQEIFNQACGLCHNEGVANAPKLADKEAWAARIEQGMDTLVDHAINGFAGMPPRGGQAQLSDEDVASAVEYMVKLSQ